jgi:hypothetical protein
VEAAVVVVAVEKIGMPVHDNAMFVRLSCGMLKVVLCLAAPLNPLPWDVEGGALLRCPPQSPASAAVHNSSGFVQGLLVAYLFTYQRAVLYQ